MAALSLTKRVLIDMLKENTGCHMLDSGGAYGRHWERNQTREFEKEAYAKLTINRWGIEYTKNIYHFLDDNLTYDKGLTNSFYAFERKNHDKYEYDRWDTILKEWCKKKKYHPLMSEYTYNQNNCLSQDFIYTLVSDNLEGDDLYDTSFVVLQIHGGCDARGGFTAPKMFTLNGNTELGILDYARGSIYCSKDGDHVWDTDDSYHWYPGNGSGKNLGEYDLVDLEEVEQTLEEDPAYQELLANQLIINPELQGYLLSSLPEFKDYKPAGVHLVKPSYQPDTIYYKDNVGYCPIPHSR